MTLKDPEVAALERAGARALRHFLVLYIGFPAAVLVPVLVLSGVAERLSTDRWAAALALLALGGAGTVWLWRFLWRVVRK